MKGAPPPYRGPPENRAAASGGPGAAAALPSPRPPPRLRRGRGKPGAFPRRRKDGQRRRDAAQSPPAPIRPEIPAGSPGGGRGQRGSAGRWRRGIPRGRRVRPRRSATSRARPARRIHRGLRASRPAGRGYPAAPALRAAVKGKGCPAARRPPPRPCARGGAHAARDPRRRPSRTLYQLKNIAASYCVIMSLCYNIPIRNR